VSRALAITGSAFAVLISPPIAQHVFCLDALHPDDVVGLWIGTAVILALSWLVVARRAQHTPWIPKVCVLLFALGVCELGARVYLKNFTEWPQQKLATLARATYPDLATFGAHPFLQFTDRPNRTLLGNTALSATSHFNRDGFHGPAFATTKPAGTCRIVCLGASTTASGYPLRMQSWLGEQTPVPRFECVNLAHGFYTSNHSVVNFALNGLDSDPDFVVFHHGWNDGRAAQNARAFRGDYSHVFRAFDPPKFPDWLLVRASVIYRAARFMVTRDAGWESLDHALLQPVHAELGIDIGPVVRTFRRNVRSVVDLALSRGVRPVLVTVPHSKDPNAAFAPNRGDIERLATELRDVATSYGDRVIFVDLDRELSGRNELFKDVGHLTDDGLTIKAQRIGAAILADLRRR
jgi:hypothetical protein